MARDVIVIGAGGGGPVVAKELAARGLDVLVLEGGPALREPRARSGAHLEDDANNPVSGYLRFGPSDRDRPPWVRELPQNSFSWQVSGVGGTTLHYYGNSPRAMPGVFRGYTRPRPRRLRPRARVPVLLPVVDPVLRVGRGDAAGPDRGDRHQGARVPARRGERAGLPLQRSKDTTRARPTGRRRTRSSSRAAPPAGPATRRALRHPQARGCTFCGYCFQGCYEPRGAPRNLTAKRSTDNSYVPMALTADAWQRGGKAATLITDAFVTRIDTAQRGRPTVARGVTWRDTATGDEQTEEAKVVVLAGRLRRGPAAVVRAPACRTRTTGSGAGCTDHHFDWVIGVMPYYTGRARAPSSAARIDVPGRGVDRERRAPARAADVRRRPSRDAGMCGPLRQRRAARQGAARTRWAGVIGNDLRDVHVERGRPDAEHAGPRPTTTSRRRTA